MRRNSRYDDGSYGRRRRGSQYGSYRDSYGRRRCNGYGSYRGSYSSYGGYDGYGDYGGGYRQEYDTPPFYQRIAAKAGNIGNKKKAGVKCDNVEYKTAELLGNYLDIETGECLTDFDLFQMFTG